MSFSVAAESYDRFMGRYSVPLGPRFADLAGVVSGQRVVDVGCGPGALTAELVSRVGPGSVAAVDPSEPFVAAARERHPDVDVRHARAEELPFEDDAFDVAVAQLVVHFMADPVAGLREMRRVTRPNGVVAACVWDYQGGTSPLSPFWAAAHRFDAAVQDESSLAGARRGHLTELFGAAGLHDVEETLLSSQVEHPTFDDWWEPFTLGVGPAGAFTASLDEAGRARLRALCQETMPSAPFTLTASAWAARGRT